MGFLKDQLRAMTAASDASFGGLAPDELLQLIDEVFVVQFLRRLAIDVD